MIILARFFLNTNIFSVVCTLATQQLLQHELTDFSLVVMQVCWMRINKVCCVLTAKLHLEGHSVRTLRYLSEGDVRQDEAEDARRSEVTAFTYSGVRGGTGRGQGRT